MHITDGGGVIINPIHKKIFKKHPIMRQSAKEVINMLIDNKIYTEFYTVNDYFIQTSQKSKITKQHVHILQCQPRAVKSLVAETKSQEITKIMPVAKDKKDKKRVVKLLHPFENRLKISWGIHPVALPLQFGIVTALGISKKQGAIEISKSGGVSFENILAVGDSDSDWQFIEMCKYKATVDNASDRLKNLIMSKEKKYSFIGPSVDKNGIIDILNHFIN
jgi:hydroxymethylpyrimidine pyrophosphatase-like HAD family hydrolase